MGRRTPAKIEPLKIYLQATAFHKAYDVLAKSLTAEGGRANEQAVGLIDKPILVLSAFASELYLKCLINIETGNVPTFHNLERLFLQLKVKTRHEIDDLWDTDIRIPEKQAIIEGIRKQPSGNKLRLDLRYALKLGAEGFQELRYFYENEQSFFLLSDFPLVIRRAILRRCPDWGSRLPTPAKDLTR